MRFAGFLAALLLASPAAPARAEDRAPTRADARTYRVPYRLTDTEHVLVRVKINGKGPYNFIIDTGAPALFVAADLCKKLGVSADKRGWGTFDRFDIEGGVSIPKARGRVETPFQLEGMNGLGLAGATLHGIIGYNLLARYRLEFDFTKDKMAWTRLDFDPPLPVSLGGKGGAPAGLDAVGSIMKFIGGLMGKRPQPQIVLRGFLGVELVDTDGEVEVKNVLTGSPADAAGIKAGDRIRKFNGKAVASPMDVYRAAAHAAAGRSVRVVLRRAGDDRAVSVDLAGGI